MWSVLIAVACGVIGYVVGIHARCAGGVHRGPFSSAYDLLNQRRPWCWHITVQCADCKQTVAEMNLDERDAEAFLAKQQNNASRRGLGEDS